MSELTIGDKVGAICSSTETTVQFFGYGIYQGEEIPPPGIMFLGIELHELGHTNPKILLDSGEVVWGCECWWGGEDRVKEALEGKTVELVDILTLREAAKKGRTDLQKAENAHPDA